MTQNGFLENVFVGLATAPSTAADCSSSSSSNTEADDAIPDHSHLLEVQDHDVRSAPRTDSQGGKIGLFGGPTDRDFGRRRRGVWSAIASARFAVNYQYRRCGRGREQGSAVKPSVIPCRQDNQLDLNDVTAFVTAGLVLDFGSAAC